MSIFHHIRWLSGSRREISSNIRTIRSELCGRKRHPSAAIVASKFVRRSLVHLMTRGEWISLQEYGEILRESLGQATRLFFATSLLPPTAWLKGELSHEYRAYLNEQGQRKKDVPGLQMSRTFIIHKKIIERNPESMNEIATLHKDRGIDTYLYDYSYLQKIDPQFCRDFVLFQNEKGSWVVDAGGTLNEKEHALVFVQLIDQPEIKSFYTSLRTRLERERRLL